MRVARWALALEEFNYNIEHRSSRRMAQVDALSIQGYNRTWKESFAIV